ncbi:MAG TPA: HupE/UreJ family protein, partial [Chitinophagaceae bacterium]|nr:HupE/UreJ family protein [Chitinophagaceae bacterium]
MGNFRMFFPMGIQHITDLNGIDHILFITALCLRYLWTDWKKLLVLVTAFTIGHSVTLALSTLDIINISRNWTEFLIALTIIITAINNCFVKDFSFKSKYPVIYFYALFFGLIHGLGFSSLLKSMLGRDTNIITQLFAFNLGLEAGQLIIVSVVLAISFVLVQVFRINRRAYIIFVSGGIAALALQMAIERFPTKNNNLHEKTAYVCCGCSNVL